jgi:hypothetical protein
VLGASSCACTGTGAALVCKSVGASVRAKELTPMSSSATPHDPPIVVLRCDTTRCATSSRTAPFILASSCSASRRSRRALHRTTAHAGAVTRPPT